MMTTTRRRSNWPALLAEFIAERSARPFDWSRNNCAFFACDWIARLTGVDPAASFRDAVDSALSAQRALVAAGGLERIADEACARWRWPASSVALARRGDVVAFDTEHGPALGVCLGARAAFAGPQGVEFQPVAQCRRAWRIA